MRRLVPILIWLMLLAALPAPSSFARETGGSPAAVWTAIIPDGFPGYVYTWRMKDDGSYREDGRDEAKALQIQPTLYGHWSRDGSHMLLKQDDLPFVFDGVVLGGLYTGTLYFRGRPYSRFCAAIGETAPQNCNISAGVAMVP